MANGPAPGASRSPCERKEDGPVNRPGRFSYGAKRMPLSYCFCSAFFAHSVYFTALT